MSKCFVRGCNSSWYVRKKQGVQEKRSYFRATTDEILQQWRNVIPGGEGFQRNHVICDLHFFRDEIINEYVNHCSPLLTPHLYMKPIRFRLKKGAVPSVFGYYKEPSHESIKDEEFKIIEKKPEILTIFPPPLDLMETDFKTIAEKCERIPRPASYWTVNNNRETITWICWSIDYSKFSHQVVLHSDMTVKIFIEDREINVTTLKSVRNVNEIVKLLDEVSRFLPCFKKNVTRSLDCVGYVLQKDKKKKGPQSEICDACKKFRRKAMNKNQDRNNGNNFKTRNIILLKKILRYEERKKEIIGQGPNKLKVQYS